MTIIRTMQFDVVVVIHLVADQCHVYRFRRDELLKAVETVNRHVATGRFGFPDGKQIVKAMSDACKQP